MLEGKNVHLRIMEREDLPLLIDWNSNSEYYGECAPLSQRSKTEWEKRYDNLAANTKWFFIEKKDGYENRGDRSQYVRETLRNILLSRSK